MGDEDFDEDDAEEEVVAGLIDDTSSDEEEEASGVASSAYATAASVADLDASVAALSQLSTIGGLGGSAALTADGGSGGPDSPRKSTENDSICSAFAGDTQRPDFVKRGWLQKVRREGRGCQDHLSTRRALQFPTSPRRAGRSAPGARATLC